MPSTDNVGVQACRVYRGGTLIATVNSTSYYDTGVSDSTAYSYTVAAVDAGGNASAQSSAVAATSQNPPLRTAGFAYDVLDRLKTETPSAGTASSFAMDALGRHASRTTGATVEAHAYAGSPPSLSQTDSTRLGADRQAGCPQPLRSHIGQSVRVAAAIACQERRGRRPLGEDPAA